MTIAEQLEARVTVSNVNYFVLWRLFDSRPLHVTHDYRILGALKELIGLTNVNLER